MVSFYCCYKNPSFSFSLSYQNLVIPGLNDKSPNLHKKANPLKNETRALVQEIKSIYLSIYLSIWKPVWKRVYIYVCIKWKQLD